LIDKHRFYENYVHDIKYIVAEQQSRFLFFMPGDRINTLFHDTVAGCKHHLGLVRYQANSIAVSWSDICLTGIFCK